MEVTHDTHPYGDQVDETSLHRLKTMKNCKPFDKRRTVTLDLDNCTLEYCLLRCKQLQDLGAEKLMYRRSSSGNGYHIKAFLEQPVDSLLARFLLGDDPSRIFLDSGHITQGSPEITNILFSSKTGKGEAGEWKRLK